MSHPPTPASPPHVRIELVSQPRYLSGVRELVSGVSRRLGFDERTCSQIALAVDEALANVICHGYGRREDGRIWVNLWPVEGAASGVRIEIEDESPKVDLATIKSRCLEDVRPGGLGVHIIREVMDHVWYDHREPAGLRLTMIKHISQSPTPPGDSHA
ncbi:MAG: ATP-binding protein [Phycisphaerales bacterium]|nr:ATP-binding protein [Phycisphaerales bacterium]